VASKDFQTNCSFQFGLSFTKLAVVYLFTVRFLHFYNESLWDLLFTRCDYVGDQVLEWDGSSLQDATFEEARDIMSRSGDTVQVVLMHCRYDIVYM